MQYELTMRMTVNSSCDTNRVAKQTEAVFEFGTVKEAIAEGLRLNDDPHLVDVLVRKLVRKRSSPT